MSYELHMEPRGDLLNVSLNGRANLERTIADFENLLEICQSRGIRKVFIDFRELENMFKGAGEVYKYIREVNKLYFRYVNKGGARLRIVYLAPKYGGVDEQFSLTVAENLGFPAMLTTDSDEAWGWLEEEMLTGEDSKSPTVT